MERILHGLNIEAMQAYAKQFIDFGLEKCYPINQNFEYGLDKQSILDIKQLIK